MSTLVLGYDGSPSANAALVKVTELAPQLGLDVVVVFAYYISPLGGGDVKDYHDALARMGEHELSRARADLEAAGVRVETRLVSGKPANALLAVAEDVMPCSSSSARLVRARSAARCSAPSSSSSCSARRSHCSSCRRREVDGSFPR